MDVWSAVIVAMLASAASLGGVFVGQRGALKGIREQLEHQREQTKADREERERQRLQDRRWAVCSPALLELREALARGASLIERVNAAAYRKLERLGCPETEAAFLAGNYDAALKDWNEFLDSGQLQAARLKQWDEDIVAEAEVILKDYRLFHDTVTAEKPVLKEEFLQNLSLQEKNKNRVVALQRTINVRLERLSATQDP